MRVFEQQAVIGLWYGIARGRILLRMSATARTKRTATLFALGLLLRSFHGAAPLLGTNSWRQSDNAAIARNYVAHGYRFLEPRVDWGGERTGVVQMEFPVYQYAIALLYGLLGEHDWFGRWISIACSLAAMWWVRTLATRTMGVAAGMWSVLFMATLPLYVYYSRAVMVESAMLCCVCGGLLAFDIWLEERRRWAWWAAAAAIALGALFKPVALAAGLPLLWLAWHRLGLRLFLRPALWGFALLTIAPAACWYGYSAGLLARDQLTLLGDWRYGTDKWGNWDLTLSWRFWNRILFQRLAEKHLTWPGFALLVAGLALPRLGRREGVFAAWLAAAAVASAVAAPGAFAHEHYQLWFVPPAAVLMGKGVVTKLRKKIWASWSTAAVSVCLAAYIPAAAWRYAAVCELERPEESVAWRIGRLLADHTEPDALVVSVNNHDPTDLYHARRRGWGLHITQLEAEGEALLRDRAWRGARYLAAPYALFVSPERTALVRALHARHGVVVDDGVVFILRLDAPRVPVVRRR